MKTLHPSPAHSPDIDIDIDVDRVVPEDFPVPDDVLDLIDEAEAVSAATGDDLDMAWQHCHRLHQERFAQCRDLALRLYATVRQRESTCRCARSRIRVLDDYRGALSRSGWTTVEEAHWITHRMALWLGWSGTTTQPGCWLN